MSRAEVWATRKDPALMLLTAGLFADRRLVVLATCSIAREVLRQIDLKEQQLAAVVHCDGCWRCDQICTAPTAVDFAAALDAAELWVHAPTKLAARRAHDAGQKALRLDLSYGTLAGIVGNAAFTVERPSSSAEVVASRAMDILSVLRGEWPSLIPQTVPHAIDAANWIVREAAFRERRAWRNDDVVAEHLANLIRVVMPYPRHQRVAKLLIWQPHMLLYRTKPGRIGLQLPPKEVPWDRNSAYERTKWWDGWIEGDEDEVLNSIPDPEFLERALRTIWPSNSRSSGTSSPATHVAASSAT